MDEITEIWGNEVLIAKLLKPPYASKYIDYSHPITTPGSSMNCRLFKHIEKYRKIPIDVAVPLSFNYKRMDPDVGINEYCNARYSIQNPICDSNIRRMIPKTKFEPGHYLIFIIRPEKETVWIQNIIP